MLSRLMPIFSVTVLLDLSEHLVDAAVSGRQISGGHNLENFVKALSDSSGTVSTKVEVAPGIYRIEYQLPKSTKDAVKTVYDPKMYPNMPSMANEAAHRALVQYQITGNTSQQVVVGNIRFEVPISIRNGEMYVPTAFPVGVIK